MPSTNDDFIADNFLPRDVASPSVRIGMPRAVSDDMTEYPAPKRARDVVSRADRQIMEVEPLQPASLPSRDDVLVEVSHVSGVNFIEWIFSHQPLFSTDD